MSAIVMDDCGRKQFNSSSRSCSNIKRNAIKAGELWAELKKSEKDVSVWQLLEGEINRIANNYVKYSSWYKEKIIE